MTVADYKKDWEYLSEDHQRKDNEVQQIIEQYSLNKAIKYTAFAVLGTYGVGKTHFLYQIHKHAINKGTIPVYFLAEDLFREIIIDKNGTWTPGDLYTLVEEKIKNTLNYLRNKQIKEFVNLVDPRGKIQKDSPEIIETLLNKYSASFPKDPKLVLLVDELEGQYGILQENVQTKDRSPLREWLESKTHLKFLAFAPAGIYELGGADRDRVKRIVLPSADVKYVREHLINNAGKSNACWWLSRGKARQLFKTVEVIGNLKDECFQDSAKASRIIKDELDSIGQPPSEVPPAITDKVTPSIIPHLLKLQPVESKHARRYIINAATLDTGELANRLTEAFSIHKDNAVLISEYFKKTSAALSEEQWNTYIDEKDLSELFCLVLDHFLEYEHGNPELSKTFGEILSLYEKTKEEPAAMHGTIGTLWERKEIDKGLPLTIEEIRGTFPFPTMNPIVKDYIPEEMKRKWEGKYLPIWKWTDGDISQLFFASTRDFIEYAKSDEFLSLSLPNCHGVLCLIPHGEDLKRSDIKPLFKWLETNGKLRVVKLQHLLTDFLLSASGELQNLPGNLSNTLDVFKENKEDILLSRKTEIYETALENTTKDELLRPSKIFKGNPPDADTVWGRIQIGHRTIAVNGIALAFESIKPEERILLADLRELFRGGREGRGIGDLRYLISSRDAPGKGGHTRLPDRLLPYRSKKSGIRNTENIEKLKGYWSPEEVEKLAELARIVPLNDFLKLYQDEDLSRLLEALWRTVREQFGVEDSNFKGYIAKLEKDIIPTLNSCQELEKTGIKFGLTGIDFGEYTDLVKSLPGYKKLLDLTIKARDASPIIISIFSILLDSTNDIDGDVRDLENYCGSAKRTIEELDKSAEQLRKNIWEYKRAVKFAGLDEEVIKNEISEQMKMKGTPDLEQVERIAKEAKNALNDLSTSLSDLDKKLAQVEKNFTEVSRGGNQK